jgi:hypothetical protein
MEDIEKRIGLIKNDDIEGLEPLIANIDLNLRIPGSYENEWDVHV